MTVEEYNRVYNINFNKDSVDPDDIHKSGGMCFFHR